MVVFTCLLIGALIGALAVLVIQPNKIGAISTLIAGMLGAMLGLVTDLWIGSGGINNLAYCEYISSGAGSILLLFLWAVAQRLFLSPAMVRTGE